MAYRNPTSERAISTRCLKVGVPHEPLRVLLDELKPLAHFETRMEALMLAELADGQRVLEIGTYEGFSAILMARAGAVHVDTIDWHQGDDLVGMGCTLQTAYDNVRRFVPGDTVSLIVGKVEQVAHILRPSAYDVVFIDGDHADACYDAELAYRCVEAHGRILLHDYPMWSVGEAAEWLLRKPWTQGELLCDSLYEVYVASKD